jgi:hypothetical protein
VIKVYNDQRTRRGERIEVRLSEIAKEGRELLTSKQVGSARRGNTSKKTMPSLGKPIGTTESRLMISFETFQLFDQTRSSEKERSWKLTRVYTEFRFEESNVRHGD